MKKEKTSGILILAFGKRGYYFSAWNLAKSIKHYSPEIKVALFHDGQLGKNIQDISVFDHIEELPEKYYKDYGFFAPAKAKLLFPEFTPFDHTLYIDADSIVLKDIKPLFKALIEGDQYFRATTIAKGGKSDKIEYSVWATNETVWDYFKLKEDAVLPALQSTAMYFRKGEGDKFFKAIKKNINFPIDRLAEKWGGTLPDELIWSGTAAQFGLVPELDAVFFGHSLSPLTFGQIIEKNYILTIYGNGVGITKTKLRYIEWYDRIMKVITGGNHIYKSVYILQDKHANKRK